MNVYNHTQTEPSNVWTVLHGLNSYPATEVRVVKDGRVSTILPQAVEYVDSNTLTIRFSSPQAGSVRAAGGIAFNFSNQSVDLGEVDEVSDGPGFRAMSVDQTALLMHMNGIDGSPSFIDVKGTGFNASSNPNISTQKFKFGGASGSFPGHIYTPAVSETFNVGGDVTVEFWVNFNQLPEGNAKAELVTFDTAESAGSPALYVFGNGNMYLRNGSSDTTILAWTHGFAADEWHHIALVKNGSTFTLFADAQRKVQGTSEDITDEPRKIRIGGGSFNGFIDELRISKVARYTDSSFDLQTEEFLDDE